MFITECIPVRITKYHFGDSNDTKGLGIHFTANMEWFVLFKVYNHYSEHNSQDHEPVTTDTSNSEERRAGISDRRGKVIDRRKI